MMVAWNTGAAATLPEPVRSGQERVLAYLAQDGVQGMPYAVVHVGGQRLYLFQAERLLAEYPVSTAALGIGNRQGSNQTPLGLHRIDSKIGGDAPYGMSFVAREPTGQIAEIVEEPIRTGRDDITSRILWLDGLEPGVNQGPGIDSKARYIYIHGTSEEGLIGQPASKGCVRMHNRDVIELFDRMPEGALVQIVE
ncbi:MAG: L,D-transpeptidase family protein [Halothiobacillaceae bacterium]